MPISSSIKHYFRHLHRLPSVLSMNSVTTESATSASAAVESSSESSRASRSKSSGQLNKPLSKTRSACNRCHSQKLRCVQNRGEVRCERCLKLHTPCRFSPRAPRASLKPPRRDAHGEQHEPPPVSAVTPLPNTHSYPAMTDESSSDWLFSQNIQTGIAEEQVATMYPDLCYPMPGDPADIQSFWPDSFCEQGNANPLGQYSSLDFIDQNPLRDTFSSPGASDDHPRVDDDNHLITSLASSIQDLANLNVALYDYSTKLPTIPEEGMNTSRIASHGRGTQKQRLFAIDDLFRLTSDFIDVIKDISSKTGDTSTVSTINDSKLSSAELPSVVACNRQLSHSASGATAVDRERPLARVEGTTFMIMSRHCRLTDIYLSIFRMMQACIECSVAPQKERDWALALPRLQVGSHTTPPLLVDANTPLSSATTSMYMVLITILSSELCAKLADVIGVGDEGIGSIEGLHLPEHRIERGDEGILPPSRCLFGTTVRL